MIRLPQMPPAQESAWYALFEIHEVYPSYWTLVGGQAVYLRAIERDAPYIRPTTVADTGLDVRLNPNALREFTQALVDLGFTSAGRSPAGHEHRWVRGSATVDVLIPRFTGERLESRTGVTGGTAIAAPGLEQALRKSETVQVQAGDVVGSLNLTSFLGILIGKGAALRILIDSNRDRHLTDALILATRLRASDIRGTEFNPAEKAHLANLTGHLAAAKNRSIVESIEGGPEALARLRLIAGAWSPTDPNDRH